MSHYRHILQKEKQAFKDLLKGHKETKNINEQLMEDIFFRAIGLLPDAYIDRRKMNKDEATKNAQVWTDDMRPDGDKTDYQKGFADGVNYMKDDQAANGVLY